MITDEQLTQFLIKRFDAYKNFKKDNYQNKFIENYKLYKSYREQRLHQWQTNVFLSYAFGMIETILPRVVNYLWQGDKLVKAYPRGAEDASQAHLVDTLLSWQVDTQIPNCFLEWVELLKTALIQGTGIGKIVWNVNTDEPNFFNIDIFDFYPQPFKKYVNDMEGVFHAYDMPVDLLQGRPNYKNIDKLKDGNLQTKDEEGNKLRDTQVGKLGSYSPDRKYALIYQYWGKIPVQEHISVGEGQFQSESTTYKEALCEIGNRKEIIRVQDNPYATPEMPEGIRPFVTCKDYVDINEFWGIGDIEPIKDMQYESNELENQKLDSIKLIMNPMWKCSDQAGVDLSNVIAYPGNIIQYSEGSKGLEAMPPREIPQSVFNQQEWFRNQMNSTIGVSDYSRGQNAPGMSDTVGGISSLIEEANMRFQYKIKCFQMTGVKEFAEKLFQLDKIFIKGVEIPTRLDGADGAEWLTISPDNLKGFYDIRPIPVSMIGNKLARQNAVQQLIGVMAKAPPLPSLLRQLLESYDIPNLDEAMAEMYRIWGLPMPGEMPVDPTQMGGGVAASPAQIGAPPPNMPQNMLQNIPQGPIPMQLQGGR